MEKKEPKKKVWNMGFKCHNLNPKFYRKDAYGNILFYFDYGKNKKSGWNIDHIKPKSKGGSDNIGNLQILQTRKNKQLGNDSLKAHRYNSYKKNLKIKISENNK
jgi:5-methylcytosine-specific restriction endonuclease McrA